MEPARDGDDARPWWETDPVARRLIAKGARPPTLEAADVILPPPFKLEGDGPLASEEALKDRKEKR